MEERIYLDHAAAVPVHPGVARFCRQFPAGFAGNPSTIYQEGLAAQATVAGAREKVAALVGARDPASIIFTSGATESNNIAVRGTALRNQKMGKRVVTSAIEHISVLNPAKDLQKNGFTFTQVPVDRFGVIDLDALAAAVMPETVVTSVHYANNEIGTIEPIQDCLAREIIDNAISAVSRDPRFLPVDRTELDSLEYSVDVLGEPEAVESLADLDPKLYGVIVESGGRRGLLLPDLEGVDTVEQQVDIARRKAFIAPGEPVGLYRFEVKRYS